MTATPRLTIGGADPALDQRLSDELDAHNTAASGTGDQRELTVRVEDAAGELVAGLSGWTWGTCAGIAMLWVREDSRRAGWGSRLLEAAERTSRERGCERVVVSSFTFQAPSRWDVRRACRSRAWPTCTSASCSTSRPARCRRSR